MVRALILLATACSSTSVVSPSAHQPVAPVVAPATPELRDERFVGTIVKAARTYSQWGRVDEAANIAPALCRMPTQRDHGAASHVRRSLAPDGPHGTKLYYLWASQRGSYLSLADTTQPVIADGFTIVKESFVATPTPPKELPVPSAPTFPADARATSSDPMPTPVSWIETDHGKLFAGAPAGLYVMTKVGAVDGTDDGWVYGTVTATGDVTSAGRVASCMGCHEAATHGRLFGLQPTKKLVDLAPAPDALR